MRILAVLFNLPTLPIASGSARRLELCRSFARNHEVHLVAWHKTHLDNELVRTFWELQMGQRDESGWPPEQLAEYRDVLEPYRHIFSSIRTLGYPALRKADRWQRLRSQFSISPNHLGLSPETASQYRRMLDLVTTRAQETKADLIWVATLYMADFALRGQLPFVLDGPDADSSRALQKARAAQSPTSKWHHLVKAYQLRRFEAQICRRAEAFVVNSETDARYLIRAGMPAAKIRTIPNGVDTNYFKPNRDVTEDPDLLLFTGSFAYDLNVEGVSHFLEHTWPLVRQSNANARLMLIGPNPPESFKRRSAENVTALGYVPDMRPYLEQASVFVSPLLAGTGMKNKVLLALAMGKPIVATSTSCSGINVSDGIEVSIADDAESFARKVVELTHNPTARHAMGVRGREKAVAEYSWDSRASRYEEIFGSVFDRSFAVAQG